eukprot:UN10053
MRRTYIGSPSRVQPPSFLMIHGINLYD